MLAIRTVGAPGTHGAGRTGRPFTGDYAGDLLYRALWEQGWSSGPESRSRDDPLALDGVRIANALRCAPPQNKPTSDELKRCRPFLERELALLPQLETVLGDRLTTSLGTARATRCRESGGSWSTATTPAATT